MGALSVNNECTCQVVLCFSPTAASCFVKPIVVMKRSSVQEESAPSAKRSVSHSTLLSGEEKWIKRFRRCHGWIVKQENKRVKKVMTKLFSARFA